MTILLTDAIYEKHEAPGPHPECPERLESMIAHIRSTGLWEDVKHLDARDATEDELLGVHTPDHIARIRSEPDWIDGDTFMNEHSLPASMRAAGGVVEACLAVRDGEEPNALCLVRPPGHHATPVRGMGFCLFNNVAVAARALKQRVLIIDWDVHHGNGTEDTFRGDEDVFYLSTHRHPFYPGTGTSSSGNILNVPLPAGTTSDRFMSRFEDAVHAASKWRPEFVIVSCGFDAYVNDPIGGLGLEAGDFGRMTRIVRELEVPMVSALEGGYSLQGLGPCVESHLRVLLA